MELSIVICTYNRSADLSVCLRRLEDLGYPGTHEILVVDNSDDPRERSANEQSARACAGVTYLVSEPPGLSRARNVGLSAASGSIVAFVDDDATCEKGWAESVLEGFAQDGVVCVSGPIVPEWQSPPPAWLGGELVQALACMDLGDEARELRPNEFFFGANIAFRREAIREIGGFAEDLGRTRTDLLGDEETDAQRRLRARGRFRYVPGARVNHRIRPERCSLSWFIRRYAWQGVSDARTGDPGTLAFLSTLVEPPEVPSARGLLSDLFGTKPASVREAVGRIAFARGLVGALLSDDVPLSRFPRGRDSSQDGRSLEAPEFAIFRAEVPGDTEHLFIEFGPAHSFLFDVYGAIPRSFLLAPSLDPGRQAVECAAFIRNAIYFASRAGMKTVVLLTGDLLAYSGYEHALDDRPRGPAVFGFLHRLPDTPDDTARLKAAARHMDGWFVFSEHLGEYLRDQHGLRGVHGVPLPPVFFANAAPRMPGASGKRLGLGLLGEVRPGKGFEFAVEALASAPHSLRSRFELLMAGAADDDVAGRLRQTCANAGVVNRLHLGSRSRGYRSIPDNVFAQAIAASDVMVFPYCDDHRLVFSGHFADGLVAGCTFLASKGSLLGDIVERHDVGETFEPGDRPSFLAALARVAERLDGGVSGVGRARLLADHAPANARAKVQEILSGGPAAEDAGARAGRGAALGVAEGDASLPRRASSSK